MIFKRHSELRIINDLRLRQRVYIPVERKVFHWQCLLSNTQYKETLSNRKLSPHPLHTIIHTLNTGDGYMNNHRYVIISNTTKRISTDHTIQANRCSVARKYVL